MLQLPSKIPQAAEGRARAPLFSPALLCLPKSGDWIDPGGAHGWSHSLAETMEPLGAALSILRFMLISKRLPGKLSSANDAEAASASGHGGTASSSQGICMEPSQDGGSRFDRGILNSWLELLLKACSALSSELNQEQQATSVTGLPEACGVGQGVSAANESRLAMLLGLDRVTEAVQWCRDALHPQQ